MEVCSICQVEYPTPVTAPVPVTSMQQLGAQTTDQRVSLACNHIFHAGCITPWLTQEQSAVQASGSCPICKAVPDFVHEFQQQRSTVAVVADQHLRDEQHDPIRTAALFALTKWGNLSNEQDIQDNLAPLLYHLLISNTYAPLYYSCEVRFHEGAVCFIRFELEDEEDEDSQFRSALSNETAEIMNCVAEQLPGLFDGDFPVDSKLVLLSSLLTRLLGKHLASKPSEGMSELPAGGLGMGMIQLAWDHAFDEEQSW